MIEALIDLGPGGEKFASWGRILLEKQWFPIHKQQKTFGNSR